MLPWSPLNVLSTQVTGLDSKTLTRQPSNLPFDGLAAKAFVRKAGDAGPAITPTVTPTPALLPALAPTPPLAPAPTITLIPSPPANPFLETEQETPVSGEQSASNSGIVVSDVSQASSTVQDSPSIEDLILATEDPEWKARWDAVNALGILEPQGHSRADEAGAF